jgi:hypothetical protein
MNFKESEARIYKTQAILQETLKETFAGHIAKKSPST